MAATLRKAYEEVEMTYPKPLEFVAQGDRVLAIGGAAGKIKGEYIIGGKRLPISDGMLGFPGSRFIS